MTKTLVVGATGVLGQQVVLQLRARGVPVRALVRDLVKAPALVALGVEVVQGDLTDPATLQRACSGASQVMAAAHGLLGRGRQRSERVDDAGHRALIAAARAAGVERFVYTSAYGAAPDHPIDFFRTKWAIEQVLAASGLDHVVLRPTAFMEHHAHNFNGAGLLAKGKAQLIGRGTKLRNFIAATDVATLAVRALLDVPPPFRRLDMGGPGNYSNLDVTALYAKAAGIKAHASHLPAAVARLLSIVAAPIHPGMARVMRLMSLPDDAFDERFYAADALERNHGVRLTTLEAFVAGQVARHRPARTA